MFAYGFFVVLELESTDKTSNLCKACYRAYSERLIGETFEVKLNCPKNSHIMALNTKHSKSQGMVSIIIHVSTHANIAWQTGCALQA